MEANYIDIVSKIEAYYIYFCNYDAETGSFFANVFSDLFSITKKCTQMFKFCYHLSLKFEYKKLFIKLEEIRKIQICM